MKIVVIRHAIAEDRVEFSKSGLDDDLRPLTSDGSKKMVKLANWLKTQHPEIKLIWTSPLIRAKQTTEIVKKCFKKIPVQEKKELEPEISPDNLFREILDLAKSEDFSDATIAVVGHEPHLSRFLAWSTAGQPKQSFKLKKGGMALLEIDANDSAGDGLLRWLVTPKIILN